MTSSRQLVHISSSSSSEREVVLGVAGRLPPPGQFTPLMVERRRESREDKQTWRFTQVCGCGGVSGCYECVSVYLCLFVSIRTFGLQ